MKTGLIGFFTAILCGIYITAYNIGLYFIASKLITYSWWWLLLFIPIAILITTTVFFVTVNLTKMILSYYRDMANNFIINIAHTITIGNGILFLFIRPLDIITTNIGQGFGYYFGAIITFIAVYFWNDYAFGKIKFNNTQQ